MTSKQPSSPLHQPAPHESAHLHVTGRARYVDDLPPPHGLLLGYVVPSPVARGRIVRLDTERARQVSGVAAVLTAGDIPGTNDIAPVAHDEPLLAAKEVHAIGQSIALVVGESWDVCRQAAALIELEVEEETPALTIRDAVARGEFLSDPHVIRRGDVDAALATAHLRISGEVETPAQDHFYLETHAALALPQEDDTVHIYSSTQHPSGAQMKVAEILGVGRHKVVVEVPRMGGAFGGKETQGAHFAAFAALGAWATRRPVKVWLNRDQDMMQTGKRHPFWAEYDAGFDREGHLLALRVRTYSDGGWSRDLSQAILDRCLFHLDSSYFVPNLELIGQIARTNNVSNTAFRGFGGPQGILITETIINRAARRLGLDPAEVRAKNFYGEAPRNIAPYGQEVPESRGARIFAELCERASYVERRAEIDRFNAGSKWVKRGIAFQPVKFGISFTSSMLNQAGALVLVYSDGTVQVNHSGTEMGQGLHTKILAVAAHELGVPVDRVRVMATSTDKVPNTSPTAASSGSDLNGQAIKDACAAVLARMRPVAAGLLGAPADRASSVVFRDGHVWLDGAPEKTLSFAEVAHAAWFQQTSLSATGYYRTPGIHYDRARGRGAPFYYYAYGGAITEVEVSALTGEHRLVRVDVLHDVGDSLVPSIDRGQIEGGFIQGYGWLTTEEVLWDAQGKLQTHSPDTYKVPAIGDAPLDFRVHLLSNARQDGVIHGSKAVGEPPFMLAISAVTAIEHAISAYISDDRELLLRLPCTPESVLRAIDRARDPRATSAEVSESPGVGSEPGVGGPRP